MLQAAQGMGGAPGAVSDSHYITLKFSITCHLYYDLCALLLDY